MQAEWRYFFPGASAARLYAVAADVEAYPDFLPGCLATRVLDRGAGGWRVDNLFGLGLLRARFLSRAFPEPPHHLRVTSDDGPWRRLVVDWRFADRDDGADVVLRVEATFRFRMIEKIAAPLFMRLEPRLAAAFQRRLAWLENR